MHQLGTRPLTRTGRLARWAATFAVFVTLIALASPAAIAGTPISLSGTLPDGATYLIQVPSPWNGTLILYSHGYVTPGSANPAVEVGDPLTGGWLLGHGFALAGSSYATTGWAIHEAIPDQIATLDKFAALVRRPARTIAWGHSLGGMVTAGLVQEHPGRFAGALPMCGVVGGGVGSWNQALDSAFALQRLLGGDSLQIVSITNPSANLQTAEQLLVTAQATPQGRARVALAAALADIPGWFSPASPEPAATDFDAQEANQILWLEQVDAPFEFAFRAELEARAGGNVSWNTAVNYARQLGRSVDETEVRALYKEAGLSLQTDLATLAGAPRVGPELPAVFYLTQNIVFNGNLGGVPVLTIHTTGDGLVVNEQEQAYRSVVQDAQDRPLLRQAFVHRAGHCTFTPGETISAFRALLHRLNTRSWAVDPQRLDDGAASLGAAFNPVAPSYVDFEPAPFLRPFDLGSH